MTIPKATRLSKIAREFNVGITTIVDMHINAFSGGTITELESGITNGVVQTKNGITYLTQRPSIDIFEDARRWGEEACRI